MGLWIAKEIVLMSAISAQCMNVTDRQIYRPRNRNMLCNWQVLHENYTTLNNLATATLLTSSITLGSNSLKTFGLQKITSTTNEYRLTSRATSLAELTDYSQQLQKRQSILNRRPENKSTKTTMTACVLWCEPAVQMWQLECGAHAMPLTHARWLFRRATGVHGTLTSSIITCITTTN